MALVTGKDHPTRPLKRLTNGDYSIITFNISTVARSDSQRSNSNSLYSNLLRARPINITTSFAKVTATMRLLCSRPNTNSNSRLLWWISGRRLGLSLDAKLGHQSSRTLLIVLQSVLLGRRHRHSSNR